MKPIKAGFSPAHKIFKIVVIALLIRLCVSGVLILMRKSSIPKGNFVGAKCFCILQSKVGHVLLKYKYKLLQYRCSSLSSANSMCLLSQLLAWIWSYGSVVELVFLQSSNYYKWDKISHFRILMKNDEAVNLQQDNFS